MQIPHHCTLCPRACGADRAAGQRGFCGADNTLRVARAALHHWEEPCLSGDPNAETGSGTVFFSGCTLKCCYCQNYPIAVSAVGHCRAGCRAGAGIFPARRLQHGRV